LSWRFVAVPGGIEQVDFSQIEHEALRLSSALSTQTEALANEI